MPVLIGTSGWQYRDWRGRFYPKDVPQRLWLEHYAERFVTVEVNNAFYRLPDAGVFAGWAERTPDDFIVGVKCSRYLTHIKRLRDAAEPVTRFVDRAKHLGPKLGPVLLQLPPNLKVDLPSLGDVLHRFPADWRIAVEVRHESWLTDELCALLAAHDAAFCLADSPRRRLPLWRTASWGYLRMHEGTATPRPCYGRTALDSWARRLADQWKPDDDVYVYFNNDPKGCAVRDARLFASSVRRAGLDPTRVPEPAETPAG